MCLLSSFTVADTLDNARALFEFAESAYPALLRPAKPPTQEMQGFYVRHYTKTGICLGVQGDNFYAYGPQFVANHCLYGKACKPDKRGRPGYFRCNFRQSPLLM